MSSESRTSGDGEAKDFVQDQQAKGNADPRKASADVIDVPVGDNPGKEQDIASELKDSSKPLTTQSGKEMQSAQDTTSTASKGEAGSTELAQDKKSPAEEPLTAQDESKEGNQKENVQAGNVPAGEISQADKIRQESTSATESPGTAVDSVSSGSVPSSTTEHRPEQKASTSLDSPVGGEGGSSSQPTTQNSNKEGSKPVVANQESRQESQQSRSPTGSKEQEDTNTAAGGTTEQTSLGEDLEKPTSDSSPSASQGGQSSSGQHSTTGQDSRMGDSSKEGKAEEKPTVADGSVNVNTSEGDTMSKSEDSSNSQEDSKDGKGPSKAKATSEEVEGRETSSEETKPPTTEAESSKVDAETDGKEQAISSGGSEEQTLSSSEGPGSESKEPEGSGEATGPPGSLPEEKSTRPTDQTSPPQPGDSAGPTPVQPPSGGGQDDPQQTEGQGTGSWGGEATTQEESVIPDDFFYDYDTLCSKPEAVDMSLGILKLHHSFGFECQKRSNLVVLGKEGVGFAAGNFVVLADLSSGQLTFIRSLSGGGIGALTVHPSCQYFAVGEKGSSPQIAVYTYPGLKLHRLLRGGTEQAYSHMDFSPREGALLASVGGNPDFMLTVWDWKKESIVLRSKAFSQDIYRVSFSPYLEGQLTTSGTGHIRFWKMAHTFTGLKLQGQLGKFGRTELTDIGAYVELPDGKVISGTEWGNLLLWDGGFIKVEIAKKGKKTCHHGTIEAMFLEEGELITAGADGYVKVWDYETIDNADIAEDNTLFEMEPLTEIRVGTKVNIKSLVRCLDSEMTTMWYAQDANGAIWQVDIIDSHMRKAPEKLLQFPSGSIVGLGGSSREYLAAAMAEDGSVTVFNYASKERVCGAKFTGGGGALLWAPEQIDADSRTLIAGYGDGVVRVLVMEEPDPRQVSAGRRLAPKFILACVCKPHTKSITAFAVDPSGDLLATGGKDSTVFFLSVKEAYEPIGFILTPAPVTSMMWSHHSDQEELKLLVCCEDGSMLEVDAPKKGVFDTSQTYFLDPLKFTQQTFQTVKDKIKKAEEDANIAADKEKKRKEKEERLKKKREDEGPDAELSEEEEEEEPEQEETHEEPEESQKGPSPILKGFYYGQERDFWLSMGGYDAGFLYQCSMVDTVPGSPPEPYEPKTSLPLPTLAGRDMPLTAVTISNTGHYMLVGCENGAVRVFPLKEGNSRDFTLDDFSSHWTYSIHDNQYGHVTHICCSHDDKFVITAGKDGNLFVFDASLVAPWKKKEPVHKGDIKSVLDLASEVKDIEDPNAYSIEDAKQKAEQDRRLKAAEEKKQSMRQEILALRKQFQHLVHKADSLPGNLILPKEEFIMDPDMEATMKAQLQAKINTVHLEMAWEAERCALLRRKLELRFTAVVQTDHITVKGTGTCRSVSSYRTPVPSKEYNTMMKDYQELVTSRPTTADTLSTRPATTAVGAKEVGGVARQEGGEGTTPRRQHVSKAVEKAEARRLRRIARLKQWSVLTETRPDEKYEDPADLAVFRHAEKTIGDFKLKSGSDYVVPEDQRVTATKKRHELLVLRNAILVRKNNFNTCLIALRDRKQRLVETVKALTEALEDTQSSLPFDLRKPVPPVPCMSWEELPEQAFEFTKESLLTFKDKLATRKEAESKAQAGGGEDFGGFGGFGGGGGDEAQKEAEQGEKKEEDVETPSKVEKELAEEEGTGDEDKEVGIDVEEEREIEEGKLEGGSAPVVEAVAEEEILSPLEKRMKQEQLIRWSSQQDRLLKEISQLKTDFDSDLLWLAHEKGLQDILMKMADLRHINLFKELELLKEFEKRESSYTTRYTSKKNERKEMEAKIQQSQSQAALKEVEVSRLQEEARELEASFMEKVGETKFKDFLVRVFRKKIKRAKEQKGAGNDDEDSDEEDSDSDWMSSSEEEEEEGEGKLDDTVCPEGCEPALFQLACQLREKRMDYEEGLAESKKQLDLSKKEVESLKKKCKVLVSGVKTAHNDLQAFQLEKQKKLNELDQVVVLRFSQIMYYGRGGVPPTNLTSCLVFSAAEMTRLQNRISELQVEKQQEARNFSEIKQRHIKLTRDKKMMLAKVQELQEKVDGEMMLKFGRLVDLDRLEEVHVNKTAEELRVKIEAVENRRIKALEDMDERMEIEKAKYSEVLRENTRRLTKVTELQKARKDLEKRLDFRQKTTAAPYNGEFFDGSERERLTMLVDYHAQEMDMLREEIRNLQRKGGNVLPPAQPPMAGVPRGR